MRFLSGDFILNPVKPGFVSSNDEQPFVVFCAQE